MLTQLPEEYSVHRENQGTLAVLRTESSALASLGYSVLQDGLRHPSVFKGRGNLEEFHLPDGRVFVIRRFRRGGWVRFVNRDRFLDPERPFQEIVLSQFLREKGFHTPRIVAARSRRLGFMGFRLELVSQRVQGVQSLGRWQAQFRAQGAHRRLLREMLSELGRTVRRLHECGFEHSDLQPENLLWQPESGDRAAHICILDLDRSKIFDGPLPDTVRHQNLWRLWRYVLRREATLGKTLNRSDALRFLAAYEPEPGQRKTLARCLESMRRSRSRWHGLSATS